MDHYTKSIIFLIAGGIFLFVGQYLTYKYGKEKSVNENSKVPFPVIVADVLGIVCLVLSFMEKIS